MVIEIKPVGGYKPLELKKVIERELAKETKKVQKDFADTTRTWQHQPDFQVLTDDEYAIVGTDDKIFSYVDGGTRPHVIRPRVAKALRFNATFTPKTTPNKLKAGKGASGPPVVFSQEVHHPGNAPRNFSKIIGQRSQRRFVKALDSAIIRLRHMSK